MEEAELLSTARKTLRLYGVSKSAELLPKEILDPLTEDHAWRDARQRPARHPDLLRGLPL